jgi:hypothetical protein
MFMRQGRILLALVSLINQSYVTKRHCEKTAMGHKRVLRFEVVGGRAREQESTVARVGSTKSLNNSAILRQNT